MANLSYQAPVDRSYRAYALDLYHRDMHERIMKLFLALDAQNTEIDAALAAHRDRAIAPSPPDDGPSMSLSPAEVELLEDLDTVPGRHNAIVLWGPPAPPQAA